MDILEFLYRNDASSIINEQPETEYELSKLNWYVALDELRQERSRAWDYVHSHWNRLHALL